MNGKRLPNRVVLFLDSSSFAFQRKGAILRKSNGVGHDCFLSAVVASCHFLPAAFSTSTLTVPHSRPAYRPRLGDFLRHPCLWDETGLGGPEWKSPAQRWVNAVVKCASSVCLHAHLKRVCVTMVVMPPLTGQLRANVDPHVVESMPQENQWLHFLNEVIK